MQCVPTRVGTHAPPLSLHSFDQGICTYVQVTLCTPEKGRLFVTSLQGSTPLSLILLPIPSISLLHTALMSRPSYLVGNGPERRIEKAQTYTTYNINFQI